MATQPHLQEILSRPFNDYKPLFEHFITNLNLEGYDTFLEKVKTLSDKDYINLIVKPLSKELSKHSKNILFRKEELFLEDIVVFPAFEGVAENVERIDICKFYRSIPQEQRYGFWEFFEQLYVLGNLITHHSLDKRHRFLELVRTLKQSYENTLKQPPTNQPPPFLNSSLPGMSAPGTPGVPGVPGAPGAPDVPGVPYNDALGNINDMFGFGDDHFMKDVVGDIAKQVETMISDTSNPAGILQSVMSGDMSQFEGLMKNVTQTIEQKIENGEISRQQLEQQAQTFVQQMNPSTLMNQMGQQFQQETDNQNMSQEEQQQMEEMQKNLQNQFQQMQEATQSLNEEEMMQYVQQSRTQLTQQMQNLSQQMQPSQPPQPKKKSKKSRKKKKKK